MLATKDAQGLYENLVSFIRQMKKELGMYAGQISKKKKPLPLELGALFQN